MMVSKLSDGEMKEVIQRYKNGEGGVDMAKDYPVTPQAIYGLLDRRGIKRRPISETLREDVETRYCKNCGDEIPRGKYDHPTRYNEKVFCDRECHKEWKRKNAKYDTLLGDKKYCKYCGDIFYSFREEAKYCSRDCVYQDRDGTGEIKCDNCDVVFEETRCRIEGNNHNFCSEECSRDYFSGENHYNWKGGKRSRWRGKNWDEVRDKVLERDGYECTVCGSNKNLNVHHKIPFDEFDDYKDANKTSNLITLCISHHMKAERFYEKRGEILYD